MKKIKREDYWELVIINQNGFLQDNLHRPYVFLNIYKRFLIFLITLIIFITSSLQRIGEQIKPVQNARYEAYQMRIHGQNYHTSEKGNAKEMLESMIRPEV